MKNLREYFPERMEDRFEDRLHPLLSRSVIYGGWYTLVRLSLAAHLNDLENIPIFMVASLGYLLTNPSAWLAATLIRIFTIARCAHTFVYAVVVIPQPARGLSWMVGYGITGYMAVQTILHFI